MPVERQSHLILPVSGAAGGQAPIAADRSVVVVGANGAGKSRLGTWIETAGPQQQIVRRVGAQRALQIPEEIASRALHLAELGLQFGMSQVPPNFAEQLQKNPQNRINWRNSRWGGDPAVGMLSDFGPLLSLLFSEHVDVAVTALEAGRASRTYVAVAETRLQRATRVWERALPHRKLVLRGNTIQAQATTGGSPYKGGDMSDGERVALYLIGHCLAAPAGAIIVVDEPEVHLHRVVQARLWDEIELERPDCLFVYLTHDLEFASSRTGATKIWLRAYEDRAWTWEPVPQADHLPEDVLLAVLGSRKPVLFIEGDRSGLDHVIFSRVYPGWNVVSRGSCDAVVASTTAFRALRDRHHLECHGIIDRDFRTDDDVASLRSKDVHVLRVHEVEHLLLTEGVVRAVAERLSLEADSVATQVKDFVLRELEAKKGTVASARAAQAIERALRRFDVSAQGPAGLGAAVEAATRDVDVASIYAESESEIAAVCEARDYAAALRLYSVKGLVHQVNRFFGLGPPGYVAYVTRLLTSRDGDAVLAALIDASPTLPMREGTPTGARAV